MKKLLLGLGTIAAVAAPISGVVACSSDKVIKDMFKGQSQELQDVVRGFVSRYKNHELSPIKKGAYVVSVVNSSPIYFDSNEVGTVAVTNFSIEDNGNFYLTVNTITDKFIDKGIEIQGAYKDMSISGNINKKDDFNINSQYSQEHFIGSMSTNKDDEWVYFPKNSSQLILRIGYNDDWRRYLNDKISSVIADTSKSAQDVLDAASADLIKSGLEVSFTDKKINFVFNTTGREIESVSVDKIITK